MGSGSIPGSFPCSQMTCQPNIWNTCCQPQHLWKQKNHPMTQSLPHHHGPPTPMHLSQTTPPFPLSKSPHQIYPAQHWASKACWTKLDLLRIQQRAKMFLFVERIVQESSSEWIQ